MSVTQWLGTQGKEPRRILIYRLGSLGDFLVALPALHLVERAFPKAERRLLTSFPPNVKAAPSSAILENTGLVHGYFRYTYGTRSVRELVTLWWQLIRWRPDALVYMGGTRSVAAAKRDARFFRLCGIRHLIGVPDTDDLQFPRRTVDPQTGEAFLEFEGERLARNLLTLGDAKLDDPASWSLHLTPHERARAAEVLTPAGSRQVIAVSIGTKMQAKDWGQENWRMLLARLASLYPQHALALCGVKEERETSEYAAAGWIASSGGPVINLCGGLTPRESGAVFERAVLFIGHDSGPMHLAASVQTPCVAIFASRNIPRVWFPYGKQHRVLYHHVDCEGCNLEICVIQKKKCILSITAEEALVEIRAVLSPSSLNLGSSL